MIVKTRNFNPETDPKLLCTCGHKDCDQRSVNQRTLNLIQNLRSYLNRPLTVTSGGRCPNHPNEKNRTTPADHQKCRVVDIAVHNGSERLQVVSAGIHFGFNAIGVSKGFVHLAQRPGHTPVMWTYE